MYVPKHFEVPEAEALKLIAAAPFATVIAQAGAAAGEAPFVSHLPLVLAPGEPRRLWGHMARRNRQWEIFRDRPAVTAIFHGPHTYITPQWYEEHDVPTWNYAVVHVAGKVHLREQPRELVRLLAHTAALFEDPGPAGWKFRLPEDLAGEGVLAAAIVGFEIEIEAVQPKFKLSQNRSAVDRQGILDGLAERQDPDSAAVRELMRRLSAPS